MSCRLLALAQTFWEGGQWMNRQQILSRLASTHNVLYSNGPWSIWDRHLPEFQESPLAGAFERRDGVWLDRPPRLLLSWPSHPSWDQIATRLAVKRWQRKLATLGQGPTIAYVFDPRYARYAERAGTDFLVYSPYDMFSKMPGWSAENAADEQRLLSRCTLAITSSEPTREALQPLTSKPVFCVPNGVDAEMFVAGTSSPTPADLAVIPRPRIGYVGSLNRKVAFGLIAALARREPSWHFVFIGPQGNCDELTHAHITHCRQLPNVHFLPSRPISELPACMGGMDVGLLCYRSNTWMEFAYPLKLNEYLAVGLPVVGTPLLSLRDQHEWIDFASDESSWHEAIARALRGQGCSTPAARRAEARRNDWAGKVALINGILAAAVGGMLAGLLDL